MRMRVSRHFRRTGNRPGFIIPTGNLGNAFACIMAREMGLPIGPIILATNANRTIADYFETLEWLPRASLQTLASAMDVGDPSNMERLRHLVGEAEVLREQLGVLSVSDAQIEASMRQDFTEFGFATCPHTATATHTWRQLDSKLTDEHDWILVATAHPAKFETIVEPLIGETVPVPAELEGCSPDPRMLFLSSQLSRLLLKYWDDEFRRSALATATAAIGVLLLLWFVYQRFFLGANAVERALADIGFDHIGARDSERRRR